MADKYPTVNGRGFKNRVGETFWYLEILEFAGVNKHGRPLWKCRCECGKELVREIRKTKPKSCGCKTNLLIGTANSTHGKSKTSEYNVWCGMRKRCEDEREPGFTNYGGRGIKVCESWRHSFETFLEDVGVRPSPQHTIERINNDGDYEPGNCVWATKKTQARNRRSNLSFMFDGQMRCLLEICELTGASYKCAWKRLLRGLPIEEAIALERRKHGRFQSQRGA